MAEGSLDQWSIGVNNVSATLNSGVHSAHDKANE